MSDTKDASFGASGLTIGRNYVATDPKGWHEQNAILIQAPEHASTYHLSEAVAIRDHLTALVDEIVANLPDPAVGSPIGTVLSLISDKTVRLAKVDDNLWVGTGGLVLSDAGVAWAVWEPVIAEKKPEAVAFAPPVEEPAVLPEGPQK